MPAPRLAGRPALAGRPRAATRRTACSCSPTRPRRQRHGTDQRRRLGRRLLPAGARRRPRAGGRTGRCGATRRSPPSRRRSHVDMRDRRGAFGDGRHARSTRRRPRRSCPAAGSLSHNGRVDRDVLGPHAECRVGVRLGDPRGAPSSTAALRQPRQDRRRSRPARSGRRGSTCCSPTASRSSRRPGATRSACCAPTTACSSPASRTDDDPRWVDVPDRSLVTVTAPTSRSPNLEG